MASITSTKRKMLHFHDGRNHSIILFLMFFALFVSSCDQRDPQVEYEILRETVYSSPQEGIEATQEYLDYFSGKKGARITAVSEMRNQYKKMNGFFSNTFSSYCDFIKQSKKINQDLSRSTYEGVRRLWKDLYGNERDLLLEPLMESITESDFDAFFKDQAKYLFRNEKGFIDWTINSVDQVSLSTPTTVKDGTAKKTNGEYRLHVSTLGGNINRIAIIAIEGIIGFDESCNKFEDRTRFDFIEKPSLIP